MVKLCVHLQKLSKEHGESIIFADKLIDIVDNGSLSELAEGVEILKKYNESDLETHLQHEERTIFTPLIQEHHKYQELCITLGKEHGEMRSIIEQITFATAKKDLADFARILKSHSLMEENELFPVIASVFTEDQLNDILNFKPWLPLH